MALISDTHTNFEAEGQASFYGERFSNVIAEVNAAAVDVVIVAGDLTENGTEEEFAEFQRLSGGFLAPVLLVPGNHDIGGKHLPDAPGQCTLERIRQYEDRFGVSFWSAEVGDIRIIGLNSLLMSTGFDQEQAQWEFLEKESATTKTGPTIVVLHQPLFLARADEPGGNYWNIEPAPRARLLQQFTKGAVSAVLSGHIHRPLSLQEKNILFFTTPPVSFGLPFGEQPEGWTLISVPSANKSPITAEIHYLKSDRRG